MFIRDVVPSMVAKDAWNQHSAAPNIQFPTIAETQVNGIATADNTKSETASEIMYKLEGFRSRGFLYTATKTRPFPRTDTPVITRQISVSITTRKVCRV